VYKSTRDIAVFHKKQQC